jgi:hypothetical protein
MTFAIPHQQYREYMTGKDVLPKAGESPIEMASLPGPAGHLETSF